MISRQQWQKLAQENGLLLERVTKEKPEWVPCVVASIERCNEQAARATEGEVNYGQTT